MWPTKPTDKNQSKKAGDRTKYAESSPKQLICYYRVSLSIDCGCLKADTLLRSSLYLQGLNIIV